MPAGLTRLLQLGDTSAWRWQVEANQRPFDGTARAWLERLEQTTRGRWARHQGDVPGEAIVLRWLERGQPRAQVRLASEAVLWIDEGASVAWTAPLDAAQRARLALP